MKSPYRRMLKGLSGKKARGGRDWGVYIARCSDGTLYTGIAKNVEARIAVHNSGKGAAYTRARRPVKLRYSERGFTRSEALVREAQIKRLPRKDKKRLASGK